MLFCSKEFIFIFLPVFLLVYFVVPFRIKNIVIFAGSIVFYAVGEIKYIPLILLSLILNYWLALAMEGENKVVRVILLLMSIVYNFGMLFVFKYFKFFTGVDNGLTLPLGISFYTFQIVAYVIDVYRKNAKAESNIINLGVYLCMFPQLIAGPIVLYSDIAKQIKERVHSIEGFTEGIRIFALGLGAKMIIANVCGMCWNSTQMYGIEGISTPMAWIGMFAYTFQIYFDFYGYSLMAIGLGKMLGFTIPVNFNNPYMATSVTDFWRRWHITLSRWFRDYVYIPLGGSRRGIARTIFNMFIVWSFTGLWHGASWNFVIWGIIFFVLLTLEKLGLKKLFDKYKVIGHLYIVFIIPLTWIVFALESLSDIALYLVKLFPFAKDFIVSFSGIGDRITEYVNNTDYITALETYWPFFLLAVLFSFGFWQKIYVKYRKKFIVGLIIIGIFWLSVYQIFTTTNNPFLYFRF